MAFQLRPDESVPDGLRRLAKKALSSISKHLNGATHPRDETIHEARKSVKKVRAILEVVDNDHGRGLGESSKRLQAISRRLSALRDADAMLEILHKLRSHDGHALSARSFARVSRRLSAHKQSVRRQVGRKRVWRDLDQSVRKVRRDVRQWEPAHRQFGALVAGIRLSHRRGRKAMTRARADLDPIRLVADHFQCKLREKALARAKRIYAKKFREYVEVIERAWKTAQP